MARERLESTPPSREMCTQPLNVTSADAEAEAQVKQTFRVRRREGLGARGSPETVR